MNDDATGKIYYTPAKEKPLGMPCHVGQRTVDKEKEEHHEEQVCREAHPLGKRPRNERGRDDGELHLEQGKQR